MHNKIGDRHGAGHPMPDTAVRSARRRGVRKPHGLRLALGIFQFMVMQTIKRHDNGAFVAQIEADIMERYNILVDAAQCYVTAAKLAELDYLSHEMVQHPHGTARPVRMYRVTEKGEAAMVATAQLVTELMGNGKGSSHVPDTTVATATKRRARPRAQDHRQK